MNFQSYQYLRSLPKISLDAEILRMALQATDYQLKIPASDKNKAIFEELDAVTLNIDNTYYKLIRNMRCENGFLLADNNDDLGIICCDCKSFYCSEILNLMLECDDFIKLRLWQLLDALSVHFTKKNFMFEASEFRDSLGIEGSISDFAYNIIKPLMSNISKEYDWRARDNYIYFTKDPSELWIPVNHYPNMPNNKKNKKWEN